MKFFHDMIFFSFMLYLGGGKTTKTNKQETKTQQIRVAYQPPFQGN